MNGILEKTKHAAEFCGDGISVAMVFRCVEKEVSVFTKTTNRWRFDLDPNYNKSISRFLERNRKGFDELKILRKNEDQIKAIDEIGRRLKIALQKY